MMPPHTTATEPEDGGTLTGDVLLIRGWSLVYTEPDTELTVVDVEEGSVLPFTWGMNGEDVGEGDQPGAVQVRCELRVRVQGLVPGRRYRLDYLDTAVEFLAS
jgi:hypothetical protein